MKQSFAYAGQRTVSWTSSPILSITQQSFLLLSLLSGFPWHHFILTWKLENFLQGEVCTNAWHTRGRCLNFIAANAPKPGRLRWSCECRESISHLDMELTNSAMSIWESASGVLNSFRCLLRASSIPRSISSNWTPRMRARSSEAESSPSELLSSALNNLQLWSGMKGNCRMLRTADFSEEARGASGLHGKEAILGELTFARLRHSVHHCRIGAYRVHSYRKLPMLQHHYDAQMLVFSSASMGRTPASRKSPVRPPKLYVKQTKAKYGKIVYQAHVHLIKAKRDY